MAKKHPKQMLPQEDIEFVSSLSQATLEQPKRYTTLITWTIVFAVVWLIVWANMAELDKIVRGSGKVVPSNKVQIVQNLEGGIIGEILVSSGDLVEKEQTLILLDNTQFASSFSEKLLEMQALKAKAARLTAEANTAEFVKPQDYESDFEKQFYIREQNLLLERKKQEAIAIGIIQQQIVQHQTELDNAREQLDQLRNSLQLLDQEIEMTEPLVLRGFASEVSLLKTRRERNDTFGKLNSIEQSIPKYRALIAETKQKIAEIRQKNRNEAQESLNETLARISQLENINVALEDKVQRTNIKSPVSGVISELLVNTLGEVVQPGSDLAKIVPIEDSLVLETRVQPSDIGFLKKGLPAKVKFTAYDFAVYGGLDGTVEQISADTITDGEGKSYYLVRIRTEKNYLGAEDQPLNLMPGMMANVDVIVGKHTILDYLLKPILKTKELALRES
ncbi:HlyD family type I secretion periplasmic adaptor subunit [Marinomonas fungiae]|uniref:Membrane fusion protein (MFP) family protein n=1 Tax=Marinomonas fungiae TaxID=1137284 RepID=A0A0K6IM52_9GAMM|nr:HlyD family type I secretion periplasmic adaptor subunit [Marinomonas fungiae]CUB04190.1 type I secretion membrane fusion protein, HlyD family [Marinomonas fungiae]